MSRWDKPTSLPRYGYDYWTNTPSSGGGKSPGIVSRLRTLVSRRKARRSDSDLRRAAQHWAASGYEDDGSPGPFIPPAPYEDWAED